MRRPQGPPLPAPRSFQSCAQPPRKPSPKPAKIRKKAAFLIYYSMLVHISLCQNQCECLMYNLEKRHHFALLLSPLAKITSARAWDLRASNVGFTAASSELEVICWPVPLNCFAASLARLLDWSIRTPLAVWVASLAQAAYTVWPKVSPTKSTSVFSRTCRNSCLLKIVKFSVLQRALSMFLRQVALKMQASHWMLNEQRQEPNSEHHPFNQF